MIPVIKWSIYQRKWYIFWWLVGIAAFIFINMVFYPSFRDQAAEFEKTFAQMPEATRALFSDTGDFLTPTGYLSSQIFYLMMPMLLGILAISLGSSLINREEKDGTIELLLSRPVSRTALMAGKAITGLIIIAVVGFFGSLTTVIMAKAVDLAVPSQNILNAGLAAILLAISFGSIAFLITTLGRKARAASVGIATLFALGGYILASLSGTIIWLRWPSRFLPFHYYQPGKILQSDYDWANLLYILLTIVTCGFVSWIAFRRRDIQTN